MKENEALTSARYIFTTGRMVHDRVMRIYTAASMQKGEASRFGGLSAQQMNMLLMVRGSARPCRYLNWPDCWAYRHHPCRPWSIDWWNVDC